MAIAFVALGSNLGDRLKNIEKAIGGIGLGCRVVSRSSIYETEPKYLEDQPKFLNAVLRIETEMKPEELLEFLQGIEKKLGRQREKEIRFGPRIIDLDILIYRNVTQNTRRKTHDARLKTHNLTLPHPRLRERAFVLIPLYEILPEKWVKKALEKLSAEEKKIVNIY